MAVMFTFEGMRYAMASAVWQTRGNSDPFGLGSGHEGPSCMFRSGDKAD